MNKDLAPYAARLKKKVGPPIDEATLRRVLAEEREKTRAMVLETLASPRRTDALPRTAADG